MGQGTARGMASLIGVLLMVGVVVVVAATMTVFVFDIGSGVSSPAPTAETDYELVADGDERTIAITLTAGDAIATEKLYVVGSKDIDIGGAPGSDTPALEEHASELETFTESSGDNSPQVGIGETWDAGETVYIDPVDGVDGVRITIYWTSETVEGINPGQPEGEHSYKISEFTVRG
ncbi:type IV pilin [Haloarcula sediminis]|uniref:type IV pilin n=1 Tax=Haloarcula sediminis TaxID=3111777 RepID=UPI002D7A058B|nr:type IV pilin [Haloarcula sp. CK38]